MGLRCPETLKQQVLFDPNKLRLCRRARSDVAGLTHLRSQRPTLPALFGRLLEQVAAQTIIAIPYEEQEEVIGPHGRSYVRSVARALPVAVLRPVVGASEALSCTLLGFRNYMSPVIRREEEGKWK